MRMWTSLISCLLLLLLVAPAESSGLPKILVINSYHAEFPWVISHNAALSEQLDGVAELEFFNMDTKRIHPAHHQERANLALSVYKSSKPDLVILTDDNALAFLGREITSLGTPVVYLGINGNPRQYVGNSPFMTGVLERPLLKRSVYFLQDILSHDLDKCMLLFDNGPTSHVIVENTFTGHQSIMIGTTKTEIVLAATFEQWKQQVLSAGDNGYDVIILGLYHTVTDNEGHHVPADYIAHWTSANSPIPVFGFWDFSVGKDKTIGGLVLAGRPQGEAAAKLAKRLLAGEKIYDVQPVTAETGRFLFSRSQMKRWGITLPAGMATPSDTLEFVE